jgi:hypothetical protein
MEDGVTCAFKWDINYLTWKEFSNAMITQKGHIWEKCLLADLVCGGLNFSYDFM